MSTSRRCDLRPYYDEDGISIYCGDAREVLPHVQADVIVTDPVWPNSIFRSVADPQILLRDVLTVADCERIVVHLGCDSDPRFLSAVPARWPYFRTCWLRYARPSYKGRVLYGSDVAYVFGAPPAWRAGAHLLPGEYCCSRTHGESVQREIGSSVKRRMFAATDASSLKLRIHPCPRRIGHVRWLVKWFGGQSVCDPFMGSGTTALACKLHGIPFVGIEIEEQYCEIAVKRLRQGVLDFKGVAE